MLTVQLQRSWDGVERRLIGPVDGLRITGRSLRVLPLDAEILRLSGDQWRDDDGTFAALVIESPTLVYCERSRRIKGLFYGPFEYLRLVDGILRTSKDGRRTLARFDPFCGSWHVLHDESDWPDMFFFSCGQ